MIKKISQCTRFALLAAGISVSLVSTASAGSYALYELHSTGSIWGYTGTPCEGGVCKGWVQLDDNPAAIRIAAGGGFLYQLHLNGVVWKYTGTPCSGGSCPGWQEIDNEPNNPVVGIYTGGETLYEQRRDHSVWYFTGGVCSGNTCPGWHEIDNSSQVGSLFAGPSGLFEMRISTEGQTTVQSFWEYLGPACSGSSCPGWAEIDGNPGEDGWIAAGYYSAFELTTSDNINQFTGAACENGTCPGWLAVGETSYGSEIAAANNLFKLQKAFNTNSVWQYNGTPCGNGCNGWAELDNNSAIAYIVAGGNTVYEQHLDGSIWQSTGQACGSSGCPGWIELDNNSLTNWIVAN